MAEGYTPNEKNLKMFGTEANGYTMERVDSYLFQLENAYVKMKEKLESYRSAAEAQPVAPVMGGMDESANARMAELEEKNRKLREAAETIRSANSFLKDKVEELTAQLEQAQAQTLAAEQAAKVAAHQIQQPQFEQDSQRDLIAKTLLDARSAAEDIVRQARIEAEGVNREIQRRSETLKTEYDHARNQLQGLCYSVSNLLRECEKQDN